MRNNCWYLIVVLAGLCVQPATGAEPAAKPLVLCLPDLKWSLEIDAPGFVVGESELSDKGDAARLMAVNRESGIVVSMFLEPAAQAGDAKACREHYWSRAQKSPLMKTQIKLSEQDELAIVEYVVPEFMGRATNQRHLNAYLSHGGYWGETIRDPANDDSFAKYANNPRFKEALARFRSAPATRPAGGRPRGAGL
jgi:hypothetical protein